MDEQPRIVDFEGGAANLRMRIVLAASRLVAEGGPDAATTRAVAAAAAVQAPTIYRLFGDKRGLLDAVAEEGLRSYVAEKGAREPHPDPVQELRNGWDMHIEFALSHPGIFNIIAVDPRPQALSPVRAAGLEVLRRRVRNVASAGRLRVSESRAIALLHAVGTGTILSLIGQEDASRDLGLSEVARESVIAAITTKDEFVADEGPRVAATKLRTCLDDTPVLSAGEKALMTELLDKMADGGR